LADNCPLVVLEAMACGLPVVAFGTGGIPELVRDGVDGCVVEPGSTNALISALTVLLDDGAKRSSAGAEARSRTEASFGVARMIENYLKLYGEVAPAPAP
jgi:glycosyltransferase involved in cell wall biosynthesis